MFIQEAQLAEGLSRVSSDESRKKQLERLLEPFARFSSPIRLPLSPQHSVLGVDIAHCKARKSISRLFSYFLFKQQLMSSNAAPVLVRFVGVDGSPSVIVKSGDDLRQDEFALLFAQLLNAVWRNARIDARVVTYRVVSILKNCGMIEMVEGEAIQIRGKATKKYKLKKISLSGCKTVGSIQGGVSGVFSKELIAQWLLGKTSSSVGWNDLMKQFVPTLAGSSFFCFCQMF